MIFTITSTYSGHAVAELEYDEFWDVWICSPDRANMTSRKTPVDGYSFSAPGEWAAVQRASFHKALLRMAAEEGKYSISIRGVRYLRRLAEDPVPGPQPIKPLPHGEGFSMTTERRQL